VLATLEGGHPVGNGFVVVLLFLAVLAALGAWGAMEVANWEDKEE